MTGREKIDRAPMIEAEFRKNHPGADPAELLRQIANIKNGSATLDSALRRLLAAGGKK